MRAGCRTRALTKSRMASPFPAGDHGQDFPGGRDRLGVRADRDVTGGDGAAYKKPTGIVVLDQLPRNASGKVLKHELRTKYGRPAG
jgi:acyl-CoA synthetase (AMP-forming)/AMP-acid ligase II